MSDCLCCACCECQCVDDAGRCAVWDAANAGDADEDADQISYCEYADQVVGEYYATR